MEMHMEEIETGNSGNPALAYVFEEAIGPECLCISFKINVTLDGSGSPITEDYQLARSVVRYMKEHADIVGHSQGLHTEGRRQIPHIHLHFIINSTVEWCKIMSNRSQHRKRWFDKNELPYPSKKGIMEMRPQELDTTKPKWLFLSYPLKEGKFFKNQLFFEWEKEPMTLQMRTFLLGFGTDLYNQKVARDYNNEKADERKEIKYNEILKVAQGFFGGTYREYQVFMEEEYLEPMIDQGFNVPDIDNYKKNIKRAAVQLKFFKSYDI